MTNEIKEILDFKENADYKRLSVDEIIVIRDNIINLQEENKKLSKEIKNIEKEDDEIRVKNSFLVNGFHELDIRIDKAIEKLKTLMPICIMPNNMLIQGTEKAKIIEEALNILQGDVSNDTKD